LLMGEIIIEQPHFDNRTFILFCQATMLQSTQNSAMGKINRSLPNTAPLRGMLRDVQRIHSLRSVQALGTRRVF
jgi:hypothetical protein